MTYGCAAHPDHAQVCDGAAVSHLAELVRGCFSNGDEGPLIHPSGTFSPRGEGQLAAFAVERESGFHLRQRGRTYSMVQT
jgi:hypothetical protein